MATKKPTAAQLAARKLFAQRAKAGTLKKKAKPAAKRKANPVKKSAPAKKTVAVRKTNPVKARITIRPAYSIDGNPVVLVDSKKTATEIAEVLATYYRTPFEVHLP